MKTWALPSVAESPVTTLLNLTSPATAMRRYVMTFTDTGRWGSSCFSSMKKWTVGLLTWTVLCVFPFHSVTYLIIITEWAKVAWLGLWSDHLIVSVGYQVIQYLWLCVWACVHTCMCAFGFLASWSWTSDISGIWDKHLLATRSQDVIFAQMMSFMSLSTSLMYLVLWQLIESLCCLSF